MSLDMGSRADRAMLNEFIRRRPKRWRGLSDEAKDELAAGLREANAKARALLNDPDTAMEATKALAQIVGVGVRMEGQNQGDEHHAEDLEVKKANAVVGAMNAGMVPKNYHGLDPGKV